MKYILLILLAFIATVTILVNISSDISIHTYLFLSILSLILSILEEISYLHFMLRSRQISWIIAKEMVLSSDCGVFFYLSSLFPTPSLFPVIWARMGTQCLPISPVWLKGMLSDHSWWHTVCPSALSSVLFEPQGLFLHTLFTKLSLFYTWFVSV